MDMLAAKTSPEMASKFLFIAILFLAYFVVQSYVIVLVSSSATVSYEQIENCTIACLENEEFCVGMNFVGDECILVTDRSAAIEFYVYDRNPISAMGCPGGDISTEVANDGNWNSWGPSTECPATCGMNGVYSHNRTCPTEPQTRGYDCDGSTIEYLACPDTMCSFPNVSCYGEFYTKKLNKTSKMYTCQLIPGAVDTRLEQGVED
ncbi:unnamed protein product, partial [Mesorhabditis spiculigera]